MIHNQEFTNQERRNLMHQSKLILFTSLLLVSTLTHAEIDNYSSNKESIGFGLGAIIGGLIAGPPGAVIGAVGGSMFGHQKIITMETRDWETIQNDAYESLEKQLHQKSNELALLQNKIAHNIDQGRSELARTMRDVNLENKRSALKKLGNGLSMSVYFRTNDNVIDNTLLPHIHELATLINDYPELKIQLSAYADYRGEPIYNLTLSKSRAQAVRNALIEAGLPGNRIYSHALGEANANAKDRESLIFDRRVDIHLTINTET